MSRMQLGECFQNFDRFFELVFENQSLALGLHQYNLLGNKEKMKNCAQSGPKNIENYRKISKRIEIRKVMK